MTTEIYYKETGYNRTTFNFFKILKETEFFYIFIPIGKDKLKDGVSANRSKITGEAFRIKKSNKSFVKWDGSSMLENPNYTYTGPV